MKIKYDFSISQDWVEDGLTLTESVCKRHNLDMIQLMDIFDDLDLLTTSNNSDIRQIVYWLAQNERTLTVCGEEHIDGRTVVLNADLNRNMTDDAQSLANEYGVSFDNESWYELRIEITAYKVEE